MAGGKTRHAQERSWIATTALETLNATRVRECMAGIFLILAPGPQRKVPTFHRQYLAPLTRCGCHLDQRG